MSTSSEKINHLTCKTIEALEAGVDLRALALADQLVATAPHSGAARRLRSMILLGRSDADAAFLESCEAVRLMPEDAHSHRILGIAAWQSDRCERAQEALEEAVRLSGDEPLMLAELAWFLSLKRGPQLAKMTARQAIGANPISGTAWAAMAMVHSREEELDLAVSNVTKSLQVEPGNPNALFVLLQILQQYHLDIDAIDLAKKFRGVPEADAIRRECETRLQKKTQVAKLVEGGVADHPVNHTPIATLRKEKKSRLPRAFDLLWVLLGGVLGTAGLLLLKWFF